MTGRTPDGDELTALVLPAFELNGEFLAAAAMIADPHGITPAQWQVLGSVWEEPLSVAEIARRVGRGLARQSVQRVANDVVAQGWAQWRQNPSHRRAKLLVLTSTGRQAIERMNVEQHAWASHVGGAVGGEDLAHLRHLIARIIDVSREYRQTVSTQGARACGRGRSGP